MQEEKKKWISTKNKYTLYGVAFGLLFPIFSSLIETFLKINTLSYELLRISHNANPLLWIIDSAPFFLGLFARIAGIKQEMAESINLKLNKTIKRLKIENKRSTIMETELKDLISTYNQDMNSARLIQEFSLPEITELKECKYSYKYLPLNPVGGDMLSIINFKDDGLSILVGDVVGHGISAALISSFVNVLSNKNSKIFGKQPKSYMENLNNEVIHYLPEDYYFTALYGFLNFQENRSIFNFSRGGHPYPFVYSARDRQTRVYEIPGTPIGIFQNLSYNELEIELFSGDFLFLVTDGILEVRNNNDKPLGHSGLATIITEVFTKSLNLEDSIDLIIQKTEEFSNNSPPMDDRLILGIEIL